MSRRRAPRRLTGEEQTLWEKVAAGARPLRPADETVAREPEPAERDEPAPPSAPRRAVSPPPAPLRRPAAIDPRTRSRLARGLVAIDARLDLHGLTQERAHRRLVRFLTAAREDGKRIVLVITGKGRAAADPDSERGVLRRQVPHWLAGPELAAVVAGHAEAHPVHGGAGALYVRLRRKRGS